MQLINYFRYENESYNKQSYDFITILVLRVI